MKEKGEYVDGYMKESNSAGFAVAPGTTRTTVGIHFWKRVFVLKNSKIPGGKIAVVLMDTQGLWDPETDNKTNCSIYGISCMLSSYLIANHKGILTSENLKHFAALTEFSKGLVTDTSKPFQRMDILLRDHSDISTTSENIQDCIDSQKVMKEKLLTKPAFCEATNVIKSCFECFDVFCLSNPGLIDNPGFDGRIDHINQLFISMLGYYIEKIIKELQPRKLNDIFMTGKQFVKLVFNIGDK